MIARKSIDARTPHGNGTASKSSSLLGHLAFLLLFGVQSFAQHGFSAEFRFELPRGETNGWWRVEGGAPNRSVLTLEASPNLNDWTQIAVLHPREANSSTAPASFTFLDPETTDVSQRFYRFSAGPLQSTNNWKNQVNYPLDDFVAGRFLGGNEQWIKFAILTNEPTRVFYGSTDYLFHYDFAAARLPPFHGVSPLEFERQTLYSTNRRALLGTVLYPLSTSAEYGIQFVSQDEIPRETVRNFFELVRSTVVTRPGLQAVYIPTFEQFASAEANRDYFASNGIIVSTAERWAWGDISYSGGWALGRLVFVAATKVGATYASGQLRPDDILITDGIPAELPYVAGIISLAPSTANSHVAILARSYGVPFIYLVDETERTRVLKLTNRQVVLQADFSPFGVSRALVVEWDPATDPELEAEIRDLKSLPPLNYTPKQRFGAYWSSAEGLVRSDIKYFGGKAANYGLLRRTIPSNAPVAIAISFDLWDEFMDQMLPGGGTLREEISNRLAGFNYPPDVAALEAQLGVIRNLIRQSTRFTAEQEQAITNALAVFDSRRNIRFRSSTNVEDAESFSGAGLYDSFSGCLADDQDGDSAGPSICDPTETGERGVFRAIRRVFSSFYNDNAYLERLRRGVDENTVGMAILVHHSTPDHIEMANGVATLTRNSGGPRYVGKLVTQLGAVPVANPDGTALPEEINLYNFSTNDTTYLDSLQYSSLRPRGAYVMDWPTNYHELRDLLFVVGEAFAGSVTNKSEFVLDLEYKKVSPGRLEIKQIREIPQAASPNVEPYLLNQPTTFVNWHGYYGDLWTTHRLKSRWTLSTRTMQLTMSNMAESVYTDASIEHLNGTNVQTLSGPLSSFPNWNHGYNDNYASDSWSMPTAASGPWAAFELRTHHNLSLVNSRQPFVVLTELPLLLYVRHSQPVPFFNAPRTNEETRLIPAVVETHKDTLEQYTFRVEGQGTNVVIRTSFWLGSTETFGDRPPVIRFVETRIENLTSEPIVLRSYWSQTFTATHSFGQERFLFEPRLEPGLPAEQLAEFNAADIALLHLFRNASRTSEDGMNLIIHERPVLWLVGLNGVVRAFSEVDD